jgi:hypothetical protein
MSVDGGGGGGGGDVLSAANVAPRDVAPDTVNAQEPAE